MNPEPLLAEELLLLLLDDETGAAEAATYSEYLFGGAHLTELALGGHLETQEGDGWFAQAKVHPVEHLAPPADPLLRTAYDRVAEKPRGAHTLVYVVGARSRAALLDRLVERGLVRREKDKVLGLFPRTRHPAVDSSHEAEVRRELDAVLLDGAEPDQRTGALVSLLHAVGEAHRVSSRKDVAAHDVRRRAQEVAESGGWAPEAVRAAVQGTQAAIATSIAAAGVAAATSS